MKTVWFLVGFVVALLLAALVQGRYSLQVFGDAQRGCVLRLDRLTGREVWWQHD